MLRIVENCAELLLKLARNVLRKRMISLWVYRITRLQKYCVRVEHLCDCFVVFGVLLALIEILPACEH